MTAGGPPLQPIIRVENLHFSYQPPQGGEAVKALAGVSLEVQPGEYVAVLGHNGSGKSTLAKHLNGLLLPEQGDVWVNGWNTKQKAHLREIRATVGMVFQSPDNQIVATIVEEDVAFGPENHGVPHEEIVERVNWSLEQVNMAAYRHRAPHLHSGGQKQRIAIAGMLAMRPQVLVLDEATAMLDPLGRREVLAVAHRLNREKGVTVVAITHFMHEAVDADRVVVMAEGRVALQGPPRQVFTQAERLRSLRLDLPQAARVAQALAKRLPGFPADLLRVEELVEEVARRAAPGRPAPASAPASDSASAPVSAPGYASAAAAGAAPTAEPPGEEVIAVHDLAHYYMRGTPLEVKALHDIDVSVRRGEVIGIIGHTGSGKSTAIQHFNGLLRPDEGSVVVLGHDLGRPEADVRAIRRRVGLVFQFPEAQLFERYVGDDVAFGPRKQGLDRDTVRARVAAAMEAVGLGFAEFKDRHTFSLSGGQMRRVALAGVLALEPEVLVLDEPTAGLDPRGRRVLWERILALHDGGVTLVLISHNMEELAELCDRLYVIAGGRTVMEGAAAAVFGRAAELQAQGLDVPDVSKAVQQLAARGALPPGAAAYTVEQAVELLAGALAPAPAQGS